MRSNARACNNGWRLDYWVVSKELSTAVEQSEIHPKYMGSDHCPLSLTLDLSAVGTGGGKKKKEEAKEEVEDEAEGGEKSGGKAKKKATGSV